MKLVMLETTPAGPLPGYREFAGHSALDVRFVTYREPHPDAVAFRRGENWISNRNFLAATVPRRYDYYWFTEYDVKYTSRTDAGVVDQIIADLEAYHPAVMVCYDITKHDYERIEGEPRTFLMSNNQVKIIHHSLLDWFFPQCFQIEGQWENCHLHNVLEYPFRHHVMMTSNVHARGMIREAAASPDTAALGFANMQRMHDWIRPSFTALMPQGETHQEYKAACLAANKATALRRSPADVVYGDDVADYFDLTHKQFKHWTINNKHGEQK